MPPAPIQEDATPESQPLLIYVRVSRQGDREDDRFHSPKEQAERAKSYAATKGYSVSEVIEDIDVSGGTHPSERPGMAHALEEIEAGRAGGLVAYSLDRLSRDPSHGDWLVRKVTKAGGIVCAPDMPDDITSPSGEFTFGMLLQVAKLYRSQSKVRFAGAVERAIRTGIPVGRPPFGYRQREDRVVEIDPDTAPLVAELFERRVQGASWSALAKWLSARTGRPWSRQGVTYMLAVPTYHTGRLVYDGMVSEHDAGAIVDDALWHAAQRPKFVRDERTAKGRWLLTGLLRCDACGRRLGPWRPAKGERATTANRYRCNGADCTSRVSVHADVVEAMVTEAAFQQSRKLVSRKAGLVSLEPLEHALGVAQRRFEQIQTPEMQDALGDDWPARAKERREARDAAAVALGVARSEAGAIDGDGHVFQLGHIWDDLDASQQREALQWHFREVRVAKVPRGSEPALTFVPAATRPFRIELRPPELVRK